jgi:hypothetical protein
MKRNPAEKAIRDRMAPGVLSLDGFLGHDERNLADIVADDLAVLESAGLTAEEAADFLDELHEAADQAFELPRELYGGKVTVEIREGMGRIPCPYGCGYLAHKATIRITSPEKTLILTPLHSHLIRKHGFFQGKGARFRLEPRDVAALYRLCRGEP